MFKVDYGADVRARLSKAVPNKVTLEQTAAKLYGANIQLEVWRKFEATMSHINKSLQLVIYMV